MKFIYILFLSSLFFRNNIVNSFDNFLVMRREQNNKEIKTNKNSVKINTEKILPNYSNNLYIPKSENQKIYNKYLNLDSNYIITALGPAGTGKTLLACNTAIDNLKTNKINKIIITRPVVPVEEEIGFLPGNIVKKMDPWTKPIFDIFLEYFSQNEINNMINNNIIEISPLGFMRGRTFKNSFIIADEMQNSSPNQMLMLLTRIGSDSKLVITGDLEQSDILTNNGLKDFYNKLINKGLPNNFYLIKLDDEDIQRSELVKDIIKLYKQDDILSIKNTSTKKIKSTFSYKNSITETIEDKENNNIFSSKPKKKLIPSKITNDEILPNNDAAIIPLSQLKSGNQYPF
jgi:phosphate starvation-inducible PhoH-like protein